MTYYICKEIQTDNGGYLEPVKELTRCKDCKHFDKDEFCDIWEVYRTNESYCDIAERKEE